MNCVVVFLEKGVLKTVPQHVALPECDSCTVSGPVSAWVSLSRIMLVRSAVGHGEMPAESKERFYQVMTVWDEYMAASAAKFQQERDVRRMVILAGSGHVDRGFGIPARAAKRTGGKALTVRILLGGDPAKVAADPAADFVLIAQ